MLQRTRVELLVPVAHIFNGSIAQHLGYADLSAFILWDARSHYHMGRYTEALASFNQIIAPSDLTAKMPIAGRIRVEVFNSLAMASLKSPDRDMEQTIDFWGTAIHGAKTLQSEQRFAEASQTFETMECVWPGEKRIQELREFVRHW